MPMTAMSFSKSDGSSVPDASTVRCPTKQAGINAWILNRLRTPLPVAPRSSGYASGRALERRNRELPLGATGAGSSIAWPKSASHAGLGRHRVENDSPDDSFDVLADAVRERAFAG